MREVEMDHLISELDTQSDKAAEKVIAEFVRIGKPAISALLKAAQDPKAPQIRKWALQALGAIGDKRAAPLLLAALDDERMTVRLHSLRGLSRMKYKKGAKKITRHSPTGLSLS